MVRAPDCALTGRACAQRHVRALIAFRHMRTARRRPGQGKHDGSTCFVMSPAQRHDLVWRTGCTEFPEDKALTEGPRPVPFVTPGVWSLHPVRASPNTAPMTDEGNNIEASCPAQDNGALTRDRLGLYYPHVTLNPTATC